MTETISLKVQGNIPSKLLKKLYGEITPEYLKNLLEKNGMPTDKKTIENVISSYTLGFPTEDLALRTFNTERGIRFFGIASGYLNRQERVAIKYLILNHFQDELSNAGIKSELNIAGINNDTIEYMKQRGMFKDKLTELKKIAKDKGNLEDVTIGAYAALNTPI